MADYDCLSPAHFDPHVGRGRLPLAAAERRLGFSGTRMLSACWSFSRAVAQRRLGVLAVPACFGRGSFKPYFSQP